MSSNQLSYLPSISLPFSFSFSSFRFLFPTRISLLKLLVFTSIPLSIYAASISRNNHNHGSGISASSGLTEIIDIDSSQSHKCNLNEPWLCSEYEYYESHTCTLNNVCIFNEYAFMQSGEFKNEMTHHCKNLPFDCQYFHQIKQCRTRYCSTNTLCNLEKDGYEICLIKALLCYDEYCEPDLSQLPFDYRLYDLCCHINDIGMFYVLCCC